MRYLVIMLGLASCSPLETRQPNPQCIIIDVKRDGMGHVVALTERCGGKDKTFKVKEVE